MNAPHALLLARQQMAFLTLTEREQKGREDEKSCRRDNEEGGRGHLHEQGEAHDKKRSREKLGDRERRRVRQT